MVLVKILRKTHAAGLTCAPGARIVLPLAAAEALVALGHAVILGTP